MMDYNNGIITPEPPQWQTTVEIKQGSSAADELPDRPRIKHVAAWLGMSRQTIRLMAREGSIPCKTIPRAGKANQRKYNVYLFDKAALLEWARPEGAA